MKIAILGAGSIGCYVAAKFAKNTAHELFLLARSTYTAIQQQGITVDDVPSNASYHADRLTVFNDIKLIPPCDLIILTAKTSQNHEILSGVNHLFHSETQFITLQNGLDFEPEILGVIGEKLIYSGTCWIKVTSIKPGHIRHDFGENIKVGPFSLTGKGNPQEIKNIFDEAGFDFDLAPNVLSVQLTKLALNVPFFVLVATTGNSPTEILANTTLDEKRIQLTNEIISSANACNVSIDVDFINQMVANLRKMPLSAPTDRQALSASMAKELPSSAGALIEFMRKKDIVLPLLSQREIAYVHTKSI